MTSPTPKRRRFTSLLAALALALVAVPAVAGAASIDDTDGCDEPLAILSPAESSGDLSAVAVTSQVLEQGVDGWSDVSWQSFEGTQLESVTIVGSDSEVTLTEGIDSGLASGVVQLVFCGSAGTTR